MRILLLLLLVSCILVASAAEVNSHGARDPNKLNIHVVCHTHDDSGWLKTLDQYYYGAKNNIQTAGVQYILSSVMQALRDNPDRKFVYAEMSFFTKWWKWQNNATKELVKDLVRRGQLDFVGGGFVQHDEATSHYVSMVDQTSYGHRFLNRTFGKVPRVAWQLDPFGHSATQASLMTAAAGYEALVFGRADHQDLNIRRKPEVQAMEFVWRGSQTWGSSADTFTHINSDANYSPFPGMNFEWGNFDQPIIDDPESPDYNVPERVNWTVAVAQNQATTYKGNDVLFMEGTDFTYANANSWFINLDRLIHHVNKALSQVAVQDGRVNMFYSTPAMFMDAKRSYTNTTWPLKLDDFFPYADCDHCYWTGYFVSRPTSKGFIRQSSAFLQASRQLDVLAGLQAAASLEDLEAAVSLTQHHDSITGTEKQLVANDYARRLYLGWLKAATVVNAALKKLVQPPSAAKAPAAAAASSRRSSLPRKHLLPGVATPWEHAEGGDAPGSLGISRHLLSEDAAATTLLGEEAAGAVPFDFEQCMLLNASICGPSVAATAHGQSVLLVVYNPLGWPRSEWIRVPSKVPLTVLDSTGSQQVPSATVPISMSTLRLQLAIANASIHNDTSEVGVYDTVFRADLPPLGYTTYYLKPAPPPTSSAVARLPSFLDADATVGDVSTDVPKGRRQEDGVADADAEAVVEFATGGAAEGEGSATAELPREAASEDGNDDVFSVSNGKLQLSYSNVTGRLVSFAAADGSWKVAATHSLLWYNASDGQEDDNRGQASGAYLFRPFNHALDPHEIAPLLPGGVKLSVVRAGDLMTEVTQEYAPWASVTTRLYKDAEYVDMEWTVGPIPVEDKWGKEIVTRFSTNLATEGYLLTDANGREMLRRRRDFRPSWDLQVHEPAAGNYYPITSLATIGDGNISLAISTERAQGAASLADGALEIMVHRRLLHDDGRGVAESLTESMCGCTACPADGCQCSCTGLIARGTHRVSVGPLAAGLNHAARVQSQLINDPPVLAFGRIPSSTHPEALAQKLVGSRSGLASAAGLPKNVHLLTLMSLGEDRLLLRLAHILQAGEDAELAKPVQVDLGGLLEGVVVRELQELGLSGAVLRKDQPAPAPWPVKGGMTTNPARAFGDDSTPTYDVNARGGDRNMVVELVPMAIRTFLLVTGKPSTTK